MSDLKGDKKYLLENEDLIDINGASNSVTDKNGISPDMVIKKTKSYTR